jgi:hypothetical protein
LLTQPQVRLKEEAAPGSEGPGQGKIEVTKETGKLAEEDPRDDRQKHHPEEEKAPSTSMDMKPLPLCPMGV